MSLHTHWVKQIRVHGIVDYDECQYAFTIQEWIIKSQWFDIEWFGNCINYEAHKYYALVNVAWLFEFIRDWHTSAYFSTSHKIGLFDVHHLRRCMCVRKCMPGVLPHTRTHSHTESLSLLLKIDELGKNFPILSSKASSSRCVSWSRTFIKF